MENKTPFKKRLRTFIRVLGSPMIVIHELSHLLMAVYLGHPITGMTIRITLEDMDRYEANGSVYYKFHESDKLSCFLIGIAPIISWVLMIVLFFFSGHYFLTFYTIVYYRFMKLSKSDKDSIRVLFRKEERKEEFVMSDEQCKKIIQSNFVSNEFKVVRDKDIAPPLETAMAEQNEKHEHKNT